MKKETALITGASSGIGLEIAKCLANKGFDLVLTARNKTKLEYAAHAISSQVNVSVETVVADLHDPLAPQALYDYCQQKGHEISLLVNNAGYAIPSSFDQTPMEEEEKFIRVLALAVIALTKLFVRDMLTRKKGRVMMISSVAAFAPPSAIQTLYGPIKTFINRFSEGLNLNYNKSGITSTAVCPGYTVTNFHTASGVQEEMDRVPSFLKKTAQRVAEEAVSATLKGKKVCVPSKTFKLIVFLLKVVPHSLFPLFSKRLAPGRYDK
ncbi:SDR family NAD(P)-dependent oxidoreductase [Flavobacteriaceae bacterium]|nr:SDR family NAD(P)-dependent oxidoreductase [Flavobacteriaceae bacterium]MDA8947770.1 SDR family NAD(P)-dependent oxidoreductase [Flavobacteriaceae bacterium]MDA9015446.1 SDR family NAD(P)-dependent oxidoreductase [Flavobacteriaceae bacterium]MDB3862754.1 SDR family NAD(P)-dependent oxidoreductase [Flavobacteriaceae bacterium]